MKNQYFGDIRDLFKYDLILRIIQETGSINRFLFIPMLTENDNSKNGNETDYKKAKAGTRNRDLVTHLENCVNENRRNITEIERYFKSKRIEIYIHNEPFSHGNRKSYFDRIRKELFSQSLIFVDPDNGLKVGRSNKKHLLYPEVKDLYNYMDEDSILMIFQYFPREDHKEYLRRRTNELKKLTEDLPIYISDNEIIFFLLTKNDELKSQLEKIINRYRRDYPYLRKGSAILIPSVATS